MISVKDLRECGLKVYIQHRRYYNVNGGVVGPFTSREAISFDYPGRATYPQGGDTQVRIYDSEGNLLTEGEAICSMKDPFCKKLGRTIALGRALSKARKEEIPIE